MLGTSFDQLHRCDMSPLVTGLGKNKLLQSNAADLPSLGTRRQACPGTAMQPPGDSGWQGMLPDSQLAQVRSAQSSAFSPPQRAFAQHKHLHGYPSGHSSMKPCLQPDPSARMTHLTVPDTEDLSLWGETIILSTASPAMRIESRGPLGWL